MAKDSRRFASTLHERKQSLDSIKKHTKIRREFGCFVELNQKKTFDRMELLLNLRSCKHTGSLPYVINHAKKF